MDQKLAMLLNSPDFSPFGEIPDRFTCEGENVNPTFNISNVPAGTRSFALIVDDSDAITPKGPWVHWLIWNIDAESVRSIGDNTVPPGAVQGINSFGFTGWAGPCPPTGKRFAHNYRFMVFALNDFLDLPEGKNKFELEAAMEEKILASAELVGKYSRITASSETELPFPPGAEKSD
ncbi:MAG TPA: YbhB/YbcL family Raf kinase inhibitor-like protein [Clostridia bacterium]|nr:YbhB/YbcL family Raf kinase inhibitor-like protein [Clostridia bacterium]